jgi:hypothetical protein
MGIGGCNRLCPAAMEHSLVALFFLSVSIEDRPLLWMVVRSEIYCAKPILAYESGKTRYSLIVGFDSFRTDWLEAGIDGGLTTALRPDLKCGGLESKFGRGPEPPRQEWNGLVMFVPGVQARRAFLGYPAELHWFTNRRFYVTVRLGYGPAP